MRGVKLRMRAVILTMLRSPDPARDFHGIYNRLRIFIQGIGRVCDEVEIIYFAALNSNDTKSSDALGEINSKFWGTVVKVKLIPINLKPRPRWQKVMAPFDLRVRGDFRPFLGRVQIEALKLAVSAPPDVIFAHRLGSMIALSSCSYSNVPTLFDLDDVEHFVKERASKSSSSIWMKIRLLLEVPDRKSVV